MKKFLFTVLLLPVIAFAQEGGSLTFGTITVSYDTVEESDGATYYYAADELIASDHGASAFIYKNDQATLEAHDTDGDGEFDAFLRLDDEAQVTAVTGEGASFFEHEEPTEFEGVTVGGSAADQDLVGSLDRITIPHGGFPWWLVILLLAAAGGGYWYWKKKKLS